MRRMRMVLWVALAAGCAGEVVTPGDSEDGLALGADARVRALVAEDAWDLTVSRYLRPLQPGEQVADGLGDPIAQIDAPSFVYFVDDDPNAFFGHPGRLVLVTTRGATRVLAIDGFPTVAARSEAAVSWRLVESRLDAHTLRDQPTTPVEPAPVALCENDDVGAPACQQRKYAILLRGKPRPPEYEGENLGFDNQDMVDNLDRMTVALTQHGYQVSVVASWAAADALLKKLSQEITCCDEVFFYYTGHGKRESFSHPPANQARDVTNGYMHYLATVDAHVTGTVLRQALARLHSCHLNVMLDCCYSGGFINPLSQLPGLETIRTASGSAEPSYGGRVDEVRLKNRVVIDPWGRAQGEKGSEFSSGFVEGVKAAPQSATGAQLNEDGFERAVALDVTALAGVTHPTGLSRAVKCDCDSDGNPQFTSEACAR